MCEKSRSYAISIAREMASFAGRANAGASCKSYEPARRRVSVMLCARKVRERTSTTAPLYLSEGGEEDEACAGRVAVVAISLAASQVTLV